MIFMRPRMPNEPRRPTVAVRITGQLENLEKVEDPEEYYCLEEIWDWDDETESEYAPDCEPFKEGAELKTQFQREPRVPLSRKLQRLSPLDAERKDHPRRKYAGRDSKLSLFGSTVTKTESSRPAVPRAPALPPAEL